MARIQLKILELIYDEQQIADPSDAEFKCSLNARSGWS